MKIVKPLKGGGGIFAGKGRKPAPNQPVGIIVNAKKIKPMPLKKK